MQSSLERQAKAVIEVKEEKYEIRQDYARYGISHYAQDTAKTKKAALSKLKKACEEYPRGNFILLKPVAVAHAKTVIKDYDKLPRFLFAVFTITSGCIEYYGVVNGVDRADAISNIGVEWPLSKSGLSLLKMKDKKIIRNKFYYKKVEDKTLEENPKVITSRKMLYNAIKGKAPEIKEKEPTIDESKLY